MAAARAPIEMKKKQDISSLHTYAVFLSLDLTLPSLLARSLYTHNMCPLFDYAGYAAPRAPVEAKKKQNLSFFHTLFLSVSQLRLGFSILFKDPFGDGGLSMVGGWGGEVKQELI